VTVSLRHRHVTDQWFLRRVVVVTAPDRPGPGPGPGAGGPGGHLLGADADVTVCCFPCHDVVQARVTLRTGNGRLRQG